MPRDRTRAERRAVHKAIEHYRDRVYSTTRKVYMPEADVRRLIRWIEGEPRRAREALDKAATEGPTHRHYKGGLYREMVRGKREGSAEPMVAYRAEDGEVWFRPTAEFDGMVPGTDLPVGRVRGVRRYQPIPAPTKEPEPTTDPVEAADNDLVDRFADALKEKMAIARTKGRGGWRSPDWERECRAALAEHIAKGDVRDCAIYLAFMWHHGWTPIDAGLGSLLDHLRGRP